MNGIEESSRCLCRMDQKVPVSLRTKLRVCERARQILGIALLLRDLTVSSNQLACVCVCLCVCVRIIATHIELCFALLGLLRLLGLLACVFSFRNHTACVPNRHISKHPAERNDRTQHATRTSSMLPSTRPWMLQPHLNSITYLPFLPSCAFASP